MPCMMPKCLSSSIAIGQTVRRAAGVGDALVFRGELVVVDAEDDGAVRALGRRRDNDAPGARLDMSVEAWPPFLATLAVGEAAGRLDRHLDAEVLPGQLLRIA